VTRPAADRDGGNTVDVPVRAMPLLSGWNETACAPTLLVFTARKREEVAWASSAARRAREVAAVVVGEECLRRSLVHLNGTADTPCRPGHQGKLR